MQTITVFHPDLERKIRDIFTNEIEHLSDLSPEIRNSEVIIDAFISILTKVSAAIPNDLVLGELIRHHLKDIVLCKQ